MQYYCHLCNSQTLVTRRPELECVVCHSRFIEELDSDSEQDSRTWQSTETDSDSDGGTDSECSELTEQWNTTFATLSNQAETEIANQSDSEELWETESSEESQSVSEEEDEDEERLAEDGSELRQAQVRLLLDSHRTEVERAFQSAVVSEMEVDHRYIDSVTSSDRSTDTDSESSEFSDEEDEEDEEDDDSQEYSESCSLGYLSSNSGAETEAYTDVYVEVESDSEESVRSYPIEWSLEREESNNRIIRLHRLFRWYDSELAAISLRGGNDVYDRIRSFRQPLPRLSLMAEDRTYIPGASELVMVEEEVLQHYPRVNDHLLTMDEVIRSIDEVFADGFNTDDLSSYPRPVPASRKAIEQLKKRKLLSGDPDANIDCAICQDVFGFVLEITQMPCQHEYHDECIYQWLLINGSCPICRFPVNSEYNEIDSAEEAAEVLEETHESRDTVQPSAQVIEMMSVDDIDELEEGVYRIAQSSSTTTPALFRFGQPQVSLPYVGPGVSYPGTWESYEEYTSRMFDVD
ncbi:hypothetical protein J3Q64DRAFT_1765991 [Phycomyces blakesleeanus]|uniref:RING-type domain-containing protein n=1 Tax=Phycomyces blakesleeanus TaxID=4837 RepID=A0ABR3AN45_PHYBL